MSGHEMKNYIVVRLDDAANPTGDATIIAVGVLYPDWVPLLFSGPDGGRDPAIRLWTGDTSNKVGDRVRMYLGGDR